LQPVLEDKPLLLGIKIMEYYTAKYNGIKLTKKVGKIIPTSPLVTPMMFNNIVLKMLILLILLRYRRRRRQCGFIER
jgi:hypothetical protein